MGKVLLAIRNALIRFCRCIRQAQRTNGLGLIFTTHFYGNRMPFRGNRMSNVSFTIADVMDRGLSVQTLQREFEIDAESLQLERSQLTGETMVNAFKEKLQTATVVENFPGIIDVVGVIKTPLQLATQMINAKYASLNGAAGFLGSPTIAVTICPDGIGYFRHFQGGSIYWHPQTGAHEVHGLIRQRWSQLGWEKSFLGYPKTDETQGQDLNQAGRFNHFQGGSIYWHPQTGAFEVHGAIRAKYLALGAESSFLGYPTTDETGTPDGRGRFNHFQAGSIYWSSATGAYEVHGLIRQNWAAKGWERNPDLGYPISDECIPDRRIGHVHPETQRKPIATVPIDIVKLPVEARALGFSAAVSNIAVESSALSQVTRIDANLDATNIDQKMPLTVDAVSANVVKDLVDDKVDLRRNGVDALATLPSDLLVEKIVTRPKSSPSDHKSQNRFSDFENGVLFWHRGATSAIALSPWLQSADGEPTHLKTADLIAKVSPTLSSALGSVANVGFMGMSFAGTTGYWFDGAGIHNRRHRLNVMLLGKRLQRVGVTMMEIPTNVVLEVQLEVSFEPISRKIVGFLTDWSLPSGTNGIETTNPAFVLQLHQALDGLLWKTMPLLAIDDTEAGKPLAILSVKTMPDGQVVVFIEPKPPAIGSLVSDVVFTDVDRPVIGLATPILQ
jgi:LGFP repeat